MSESAASARILQQDSTRSSKLTLDVFRMLHVLCQRPPYPLPLSLFGTFLQQMQLLGLVFCPMVNVYDSFAKTASYFVLFWSAPLFDRHFGSMDLRTYFAVLCVSCVAVLGAMALLIAPLCSLRMLELKSYARALRGVLESIGGWLYMPLLHLFLGAMICEGGNVANFPPASCRSGHHIACIVIGSCGAIMTFLIGFFMCWVYDPDPTSTHYLARPHGSFTLLVLVAKTLLCVMFHVLVPIGQPSIFTLIAIFTYGALIVALMTTLPYYNQQTSCAWCCVLTITVYVASVDSLRYFDVTLLHMHLRSMPSYWFTALFPVAGVLGFCFPWYRVNKDLFAKLKCLHENGVVPEHVAHLPFPRSYIARETDLPSQVLRTVEQDLTQEMLVEGSSLLVYQFDAEGNEKPPTTSAAEMFEGALQARQQMRRLELLVPFLYRVIFTPDAELATRFLRYVKSETGETVPCSPGQLVFALHMYLKSLTYFRQSGHVTVSLANFLYYYCNRLNTVVEVLQEMSRQQHRSLSLMDNFRSYRLERDAREALGYRDSSHLFSLQRARLYHRQALATTVEFWDTLLSCEDRFSIIVISNRLAEQRRIAQKEYLAAVSVNREDRTTLRYIASFVEDLLHEADTAKELQFTIDDLEQQKKNRVLRGAQPKHHSRERVVDVDEVLKGGGSEDQAARSSSSSCERVTLLLVLYSCLFIFTGASCVIMAFDLVRASKAVRHMHAVDTIMEAKANAYLIKFFSEKMAMMYYTDNCGDPSSSCLLKEDYVKVIRSISMHESTMRSLQNIVTFGDYMPDFGSLSYRFISQANLPLRHFIEGSEAFRGTMCCKGGLSTGLYALLRSKSESISIPQSEWLIAQYVSGHVTTMVIELVNSMNIAHYLQFITDGGMDPLLIGMESFSHVLRDDVLSYENFVMMVYIISMVLMVVSIALSSGAFYLFVEWIAGRHIQLMNLFHAIPGVFLEQQRDVYTNRLTVFEVNESAHLHSSGLSEEPFALYEDHEHQLCENTDNAVDGNYDEVTDHRQDVVGDVGQEMVSILTGSVSPRSCFRQRHIDSSLMKTVRFEGIKEDLDDRPRPRLPEPKVAVHDSSTAIAAEIEQTFQLINEEVQKEQECATKNRDVNVERIVSTRYRAHCSRITKRLVGMKMMISGFDELSSVALVLLGFALSVGIFSMLILYFMQSSDVDNAKKYLINEIAEVYAFVSRFEKFDMHVSIFTNFFSMTSYSQIVSFIFTNEGYFKMVEDLQKESNPLPMKGLAAEDQLATAILNPLLGNIIYTVLAARAGYGLGKLPLGDMYNVALADYGDESSRLLLSKFYPSAVNNLPQYNIPALEDLPDDAAEFYKTILPLHRRLRFYDDLARIQVCLEDCIRQFDKNTQAEVKEITDRATQYLLAVILMCSVSVLVHLVSAGLAYYQKRAILKMGIFLLLAGMMVVLLGISIDANVRQTREENRVAQLRLVVEAAGQRRAAIFERGTRIEQYFYFPSYLLIQQIKSLVSRTLSTSFREESEQVGSVASDALDSGVSANAERLDEELWHLQQIALFLAYAGYVKRTNPNATMEELWPPAEEHIQTYNYVTEEHYSRDERLFGNDHPEYQYSTPEVDLKRSADDLITMARFILFGQRGEFYFFEAYNALVGAANGLVENAVDSMHNWMVTLRRNCIVMIVFSSIAMLSLLVMSLWPLVQTFIQTIKGTNQRLVKMILRSSFSSYLTRMYIASALLIAIGVSQFVVAILIKRSGYVSAEVVYNSHCRIAEIKNILSNAQYALHAVLVGSGTILPTILSRLQPSIDKMRASREYLLFDSNAKDERFGHIPSLTDEQQDLFFGKKDVLGYQSVDEAYVRWLDRLEALLNVKLSAVESTNKSKSSVKQIFLLNPENVKAMSTMINAVIEDSYFLSEAMETSNQMYVTDFERRLRSSLVPSVVLFVAGVVVVSAVCIYIIPQLMRQLPREENKTRLLLKSIPRWVPDAVPTIALFMDGGVIDDSTDQTKESFSLSRSATTFLSQWNTTEPDDAGLQYCSDLDESAAGAIVADAHGNIVYTNEAVLDWFHYESLVGKNLSVLMEPSVGAVHDSMMQHYLNHRKATGPAMVDAMARTKEGESIHLIIVIAEAPTRSGTIYFLGEMYRYPDNVAKGKKKRPKKMGMAASQEPTVSAVSLAKKNC